MSGFLPTYACSDIGSFYGSQSYDPENGNDETPGLFDYDAIPKSAKNDSVKWMYMDMVGLCMFFAQNKAVTVEAINEVTGWNMTGDELYEAGDRGVRLRAPTTCCAAERARTIAYPRA